MIDLPQNAGQHMTREIAEAPVVFAASVAQPVALRNGPVAVIRTLDRAQVPQNHEHVLSFCFEHVFHAEPLHTSVKHALG